MEKLQKTQKRAYASPVIEVLEAENDMKFLMASATIVENEHTANRNNFDEDNTDVFQFEE